MGAMLYDSAVTSHITMDKATCWLTRRGQDGSCTAKGMQHSAPGGQQEQL